MRERCPASTAPAESAVYSPSKPRRLVGDPLRHWCFYDGNGNVGQLLAYDATGPTVNAAPAAKYEYDPYGQLVAHTDNIANPFRFSTKWFDTTTGLGDWGYRYYSPRLGRWMNRDPIEERGGIHLYLGLGNTPVNVHDRWGLKYVCCLRYQPVYQIMGFASARACADANLQQSWIADPVVGAGVGIGLIVVGPIGNGPGMAIGGGVLAGYAVALEGCMAHVCVNSVPPTQTITPSGLLRCLDEVCYTCSQGSLADPHEAYRMDELPYATKQCHRRLFD